MFRYKLQSDRLVRRKIGPILDSCYDQIHISLTIQVTITILLDKGIRIRHIVSNPLCGYLNKL